MSTSTDQVKAHEELSEGQNESAGRYVAYAAALRQLVLRGSRYVAYSSDVGEAFRPLTRPAVVTAAYGISWAYILGDVGYACYKAAKTLNPDDPFYKEDIAWIGARRGVFQSIARCVTAVCDEADMQHGSPYVLHASCAH